LILSGTTKHTTCKVHFEDFISEGARVEINVRGSERRIREVHELALFRIAQEAGRNAEKHGYASLITLDLTFESHAIRLVVRDDGSGFHPPVSFDCLAQHQHFGLLGMHERVQQLNGTLKLISRPGAGTSIDVLLPLNAGDQPTERVSDPVCGVVIEPQQAFGSTVHNGERYYFCCPVCQGAFQLHPEIYVLSKVR